MGKLKKPKDMSLAFMREDWTENKPVGTVSV